MNTNHSHAASDNIDQTIDRALAGLRDAQPRSGLSERLLASLEHRSAASATNPGGLPATRLALWAATSAAVLAIASFAILAHPGAPSSTRIARQGGVGMPLQSGNPEVATRITPQITRQPGLAAGVSPPTTHATKSGAFAPALASTQPAHRMAHRATAMMPDRCAHSGCPTHDNGPIVVMGGGAQTPDDAQALADLHARSHPAPPLPLTPQEKLFLRVLRYGNATQLAELNPIVRAQEDADETTTFKAFFPDPPPVQQPNGDTE